MAQRIVSPRPPHGLSSFLGRLPGVLDWRTHADNVGHMRTQGCFRCHDDSHATKDGKKISQDCETCHKIE